MPRKPIRDFDLNTFSEHFRTESDRACAVLGAALLDARLESLFQRRLKDFSKELLSQGGPLGSFSVRIQLARALVWISEDARFDLDQIRSIRNVFAHEFDHKLSFADQSIADKCRTLRVAQTLIDAIKSVAPKTMPNFSTKLILDILGSTFEPPRQRFEWCVEMLAQYIDELGPESAAYSGPDLNKELWDLASAFKSRITRTDTVDQAPSNSPQS
jgi:hypothetical protein